jgi:hypothetical protein
LEAAVITPDQDPTPQASPAFDPKGIFRKPDPAHREKREEEGGRVLGGVLSFMLHPMGDGLIHAQCGQLQHLTKNNTTIQTGGLSLPRLLFVCHNIPVGRQFYP